MSWLESRGCLCGREGRSVDRMVSLWSWRLSCVLHVCVLAWVAHVRISLAAFQGQVQMWTQAGPLMEPLAAEVNPSTALTFPSHCVSLADAGAEVAPGGAAGTASGSRGKRQHSLLDAQLDELGACRSKLRAVVGDDPLKDVAGEAAEVLGKGTLPCANAAQCSLCVCRGVHCCSIA